MPSVAKVTIMSAHAYSKCINLAISISFMTWKVLAFDAGFRLFRRFLTVHAQFQPY